MPGTPREVERNAEHLPHFQEALLKPITIDSELADVHIRETEGQPSNAGHVVEVTIIKAGTSSNGNHYSEDLLRQAAPLFEGVRAFADHSGPLDRQERSVRDLVGHYRNPHFQITPQGSRIRADFHTLPGQDWLWGLIQEAAIHPDICGLSIDALGEVKQREVDGRPVRFVEAMKKVRSVDIVTRPAAGGSLDRILAAEGDGGNGVADEAPAEDVFDDEQRKRYATVVRHNADGTTDYKFPIPPKGTPGAKGHATAALARLDQSDLTPAEKSAVIAAAHAVLGKEPATMNEAAPSSEPAVTPNSPPVSPAAQPDPAPPTRLVEQSNETPSLADELKKLQTERDAASRRAGPDQGGACAGSHARGRSLRLCRPAAGADQTRSGRGAMRPVSRSALLESKLPSPITNRIRKRFSGKIFSETQLQEDLNEERERWPSFQSSGQVSGHGYEKTLHTGMSEYEQLQAGIRQDVRRHGVGVSGFRTRIQRHPRGVPSRDRPRHLHYRWRRPPTPGVLPVVPAQLRPSQDGCRHPPGVGVPAEGGGRHDLHLLLPAGHLDEQAPAQGLPGMAIRVAEVRSTPSPSRTSSSRTASVSAPSDRSRRSPRTRLHDADPGRHARHLHTLQARQSGPDLPRNHHQRRSLRHQADPAEAGGLGRLHAGRVHLRACSIPGRQHLRRPHPLLLHVNHANSAVADANVGTANSGTALSSAAMQAGVVKMRKQTNAASKPIGLKPRFLLVPPDLEFTRHDHPQIGRSAGRLQQRHQPDDGLLPSRSLRLRCNNFPALGATTSFCALVADPRVIDTVEIGFIGGQVNPVLFIQDQPLYGLNFTQDVISYKVRHEYGGAVVDYRGFYLINN